MTDVQTADHVIDYASPRAQRPRDSRVVLEQHDDGVSFTFRAEGLRGAAAGLIGLGLCAAALLFMPVMLLLGVVTQDEIGGHGYLFLAALIPVAAVGVGVIRAATRPTVLSVRGGRVTLFSGAALLRPVKSWAAEDVDSIKVSLRGVNGALHPTADMNVVLRRRGRVLVIAGRERADLEWVAAELRVALARSAAPVDTP